MWSKVDQREREYAIGIDIGGTHLRFAMIRRDGIILEKRKFFTNDFQGVEPLIDKLSFEIESICRTISSDEIIKGIGVGFPGIINYRDGIVKYSPNLKGWKDVTLKNILEERTGKPVVLDNDANAYAYGEMIAGAGRDLRSFVLLTLGTGIGGGVIIDRKLWRGSIGMAGEVGHMVVEPDGLDCECGGKGCLELYGSVKFIEREVAAVSGISGHITADEAYRWAKEGDQAIMVIFKRLGKYLGIGISNLINILNVDSVIIGGGVSNAWDLFIEELLEELKRRSFVFRENPVEIRRSELGDDASLIGAAYLVFLEQD